MGTQPPCKTAPNENVSRHLCDERHLRKSRARHEGLQRKDVLFMQSPTDAIINNDNFAGMGSRLVRSLRQHRHMVLRARLLTCRTYTMLDIVYDDIMFFKECGVRGLFIEAGDARRSVCSTPWQQLAYEINWNPDMTRRRIQRQRSMRFFAGRLRRRLGLYTRIHRRYMAESRRISRDTVGTAGASARSICAVQLRSTLSLRSSLILPYGFSKKRKAWR